MLMLSYSRGYAELLRKSGAERGLLAADHFAKEKKEGAARAHPQRPPSPHASLTAFLLSAMPETPVDTSRIYAVDCEMVNVGFQAREIAVRPSFFRLSIEVLPPFFELTHLVLPHLSTARSSSDRRLRRQPSHR